MLGTQRETYRFEKVLCSRRIIHDKKSCPWYYSTAPYLSRSILNHDLLGLLFVWKWTMASVFVDKKGGLGIKHMLKDCKDSVQRRWFYFT